MSDDLLRELGKELPYERPDDARRDIVRASLLAAASRREELPPQRWRVLTAFGAGVLAAAAIAMIVIGRRDPAPVAVENARIESSAAAELEHTIAKTATGTDEIVRVHTGKVRIAMAAVTAGDRASVVTSDAQVDGAGAYEIAVRDDKLAAVTVTSGTAKIVVTGQQAVFLAAGEAWHSQIWTAEATLTQKSDIASQPTVAPPSPPTVAIVTPPTAAIAVDRSAPRNTPTIEAPVRAQVASEAPRTPDANPARSRVDPPATPTHEAVTAPAISTSVAPQPAIAQPSATEQHFQTGWKLLKAGKAIEAANELAIAADGDGPIAIDARYFEAEALVKAGRKTEAEKALVGFLDRAPQSMRRGRAAVMLARLIAERGDKTAARNWFESAINDPDPAVAAAAKAGLAAL